MPEQRERPAATGRSDGRATLNAGPTATVPKCRRNAHRRLAHLKRAVFDSLGTETPPSATAPALLGGVGAGGGGLILAAGSTPRDAWIEWLSPVFGTNQSCYFTGTYSDDYGYPNGLMATRNVHKDFRRFLESFDYDRRYIVGVEPHQWRDILHLHAVLEGPFTDEQMRWVKGFWSLERGHARALPVLDGCASYVTKYALKGDSDNFEWRLS